MRQQAHLRRGSRRRGYCRLTWLSQSSPRPVDGLEKKYHVVRLAFVLQGASECLRKLVWAQLSLDGWKDEPPSRFRSRNMFRICSSYTFTMLLFSFFFTPQMLVGLLASKEATGSIVLQTTKLDPGMRDFRRFENANVWEMIALGTSRIGTEQVDEDAILEYANLLRILRWRNRHTSYNSVALDCPSAVRLEVLFGSKYGLSPIPTARFPNLGP